MYFDLTQVKVFSLRLLPTDTSAAENVPPESSALSHHKHANGKNGRCQSSPLSEGSCAERNGIIKVLSNASAVHDGWWEGLHW